MTEHTHENFSREERVGLGSERSFGIMMATALALLGVLNWRHSGHAWLWLGGIGIGLFSVCPLTLRPLNWPWFKFGLLLHAILDPVIMGFCSIWQYYLRA
jgi:hypothetical protein